MCKRILFLLRLWPVYGGGETVTICLANEMVKRGHHVSILFFKDTSRTGIENLYIDKRIISQRIEEIDCNECDNSDKDKGKASDALYEYVTDNSIDVIINQWWPISYLRKFSKPVGVKLIHCLHTSFYTPVFNDEGVLNLVKKLLRPMYLAYKKHTCVREVNSWLKIVDYYVFLSPSYQKQYMEMSKNDNYDGSLVSIPNPLVYINNISEEEYSQKENIVLLVGRMEESSKRITRALRIWKKIEAFNDLVDWRFILVGDGPDIGRYKDMAVNLGCKRIYFQGFQNPLQYYKKAKIFIMTSEFEGFGMTLLESQQNGVVPIVMDTFATLHDIVEDRVNGIIIADHDEQRFAMEMKALMCDENQLRTLACNGIQKTLRFHPKAVVDKWERLMEK